MAFMPFAKIIAFNSFNSFIAFALNSFNSLVIPSSFKAFIQYSAMENFT